MRINIMLQIIRIKIMLQIMSMSEMCQRISDTSRGTAKR